MGADSMAENTPNAKEFICPICLPKPNSSGFQWKKASLGVCSQWSAHLRQKIKVNPELKEIYVYTFVSMSIMCCLALIHLSTEHFIKKTSNSNIKLLTTNLTKYDERYPQLGVISKKK